MFASPSSGARRRGVGNAHPMITHTKNIDSVYALCSIDTFASSFIHLQSALRVISASFKTPSTTYTSWYATNTVTGDFVWSRQKNPSAFKTTSTTQFSASQLSHPASHLPIHSTRRKLPLNYTSHFHGMRNVQKVTKQGQEWTQICHQKIYYVFLSVRYSFGILTRLRYFSGNSPIFLNFRLCL